MDEDQARQEAQARRERILNQAGNRMDRIAGLQKDDEEEDEPSIPPAAAAASASSGDADDTAEAVAVETVSAADAEQAEAAAASSSSKASSRKAKIAAMRRRRFKKPSAAAAPTKAAEEEKEAATTTDSDKKIEEETTTAVAESSPIKSAASEDSAIAALLNVTESSAEKEEIAAASSSTEESPSKGGEGGKKYMGVAKMRRKMIKEREAAKKNEAGTSEGGTAAATGATTTSQATAAVVAPKKKKKSYYTHSLPILMEAVVVLLLFSVGLQVGLQQSHVEYTTILVHNGLAPPQQGLRIASYIPDKMTAWKNKGKTEPSKNIEQDATITTKPRGVSDEDDEFAEIDQDDDEEDGEENIDPLFGVDLDKVTKGPGLVLFLGRYAVKAHRVNLYFFYYLPIRIYTAIVSRLWSLLDEPPLLCVAAILIRQFIGKTVLGAGIPKQGESGDQDGENTQDIIGTIKKVVMTFITGAFPTLVTLVEAWMHLRSDMYVVLFGLFVGWAWHHTDFVAVGDYLTNVHGDGTEDSIPAMTDGATDEL